MQFDSADERRYHEFMALPALALAARGADEAPLRVLILGGGDGLALREVLRHERVSHVDLVDLDPEVLALARSAFRALNDDAFYDYRVHVHVADAVHFVAAAAHRAARYDLVLCDFTVPNDAAGCALYSVEWFARLRALLTPAGVLVTNAASLVTTGLAYWSIYNTLRAAGWDARPYHFTLPSFLEAGYGGWGFVLACPDAAPDLTSLTFAPGQEVDAAAFRAALRFPAALVACQAEARPTTAREPHLWHYLLNPGDPVRNITGLPEVVDFAQPGALPTVPGITGPAPADPLAVALRDCLTTGGQPDLDRLIGQLPVQHRYHTREMIDTILDNWAAYLQGLDLPRLFDTVLARAQELPAQLRAEIVALRTRLREAPALDADTVVAWGGRVASVLLIVIMLANTVAPDSAFAKQVGSHVQSARPSHTVTRPPSISRTALSGNGYARSSYGRNQIVDVAGNAYPSRRFVYRRTYYSSSRYHNRPGPTAVAGSPTVSAADLPVAAPAEPPVQAQGVYYLTEDALVLDTNDVVVTVDRDHYLFVDEGALVMLNTQSAEPVYSLYRDPALTNTLVRELEAQRVTLQRHILDLSDGVDRMDWLGAVLPHVRLHVEEVKSLRETERQLGTVIERLRGATSAAVPPEGGKEVLTGIYALPSGIVALHNPDGSYSYLSGDKL